MEGFEVGDDKQGQDEIPVRQLWRWFKKLLKYYDLQVHNKSKETEDKKLRSSLSPKRSPFREDIDNNVNTNLVSPVASGSKSK